MSTQRPQSDSTRSRSHTRSRSSTIQTSIDYERLFDRLRTTVEQTDSFDNAWETQYLEPQLGRYREAIQTVHEHHAGGTILDVGAVPCHMTWCLSEIGYDVTGIDLAPERSRELAEAGNFDVEQCDIERDDLPAAADSVGTVVFSEVFEHLRLDPRRVLSELHRVLRDDGRLVLTTPNLYRLGALVRFAKGEGFDNAHRQWQKLDDRGHMGHVRLYSRGQIEEFCREAGFSIVESRYSAFGQSAHRFGPLIDATYRVAPWLRPYQVVVAKP